MLKPDDPTTRVCCFMRSIESATDEAVEGRWLCPGTLPFVVLALDGFQTPPSGLQARFLVESMFALIPATDDLAVWRPALSGTREYADDAGRSIVPLACDCKGPRWSRGGEQLIHVYRRDNIALCAELLERFWMTGGGHWVFWHWPGDRDTTTMGFTAMKAHARTPRRLHYELLSIGLLAGVTFDDLFLDLFVRRRTQDVEQALLSIAARNGIGLLRSG